MWVIKMFPHCERSRPQRAQMNVASSSCGHGYQVKVRGRGSAFSCQLVSRRSKLITAIMLLVNKSYLKYAIDSVNCFY